MYLCFLTGHVEFILYRLDKILDVGRYKAQVVIEVKKLLESKEYLAQVLGELAVAGFQNKSETWGCLTDVLRWRFFQVSLLLVWATCFSTQWCYVA